MRSCSTQTRAPRPTRAPHSVATTALKIALRIVCAVCLCLPCLTQALAQRVPVSDLSIEVTERVAPLMQQRMQAIGRQLGDPIFFRIIKATSTLEVWVGPDSWVLLGTWPICAWAGTLGPKLAEGDEQSPEGFYFITPGRMNPNSQWHLGMNIGYPNAYDRFHERTGSFIVIHGVCGSSGCFAMTNPLIEELWVLAQAALNDGQDVIRVHIFPFEMTDANLSLHIDSEWHSFWRNLQEGWNFFETHGSPPNVDVADGRYVFSHAQ
jgi:murein L,D-transpeptidase YafK